MERNINLIIRLIVPLSLKQNTGMVKTTIIGGKIKLITNIKKVNFKHFTLPLENPN